MNLKILIPVLIGVLAVIGFSAISFESQSEPLPEPVYEVDFVYSDVDKIKDILATQNILMSSSTAITDHTVDQYCTFFDDENVQRFVEFCTTAALVDSDGNPLGNINMGGSSDTSTLAIGIIESAPFLDSKEEEIDFIFQTMIETLVCDCWEQQQPGDFESIPKWIDAAEEHYAESGQINLKSKITGLDQKQLILEITSIGESYLWTLIVLK